MNSLPDGFPVDNLSEVNKLRVISFYNQFVEDYYMEYKLGHFVLAAYAATPSLLTPDLMYKLWMNFNTYKWGKKTVKIHRIAVSDILLSPLVREVGFELFDMHEDIKEAFRKWMVFLQKSEKWKSKEIATPQKIADFLLQYHKHENPGTSRWGTGYEEVQEWTALAYLSPEKAKNQILQKLAYNISNNKQQQTLQILNLFPKVANQIAISQSKQSVRKIEVLEETALFTTAWKALLEDNSEFFLKTFQENPSLRKYLNDDPNGGIAVKMMDNIEAEIKLVPSNTIHSILVGIDDYADMDIPLSQCVRDTKKMQAFLERLTAEQGYESENVLLHNQDATPDSIREAFRNLSEQANDGDFCVFYFAGLGNPDRERNVQQLAVYFPSKQISETIYFDLSELAELIYSIIREKEIHFLVLIDAPHCSGLINSSKRPPMSGIPGSLVVLNACKFEEKAYESTEGGAFTWSLLRTLEKANRKISYEDLIKNVRVLVKANFKPISTPWAEALPSSALQNGFLSNQKQNIQDSYDAVAFFNRNTGNWNIDVGGIHGIKENSSPPTELLIEISDEESVEGFVTRVFPIKSEIELPFGSGIKKEEQYLVHISGFMATPLGIYLQGNESILSEFRTKLDVDKIQKITALYFTESESEANYTIEARDEISYLYPVNSNKPQLSLDLTKADQVIHQLESISKWTAVRNLKNPSSDFSEDTVRLEFFTKEGPIKVTDHIVSIDLDPESLKTEIKLKVTNNHSEALNCGVINLSSLYSIYTDLFYGQVKNIRPKDSLAALENNSITIGLSGYIIEHNWEEEVIYFQVVFSNKNFGIDFYDQTPQIPFIKEENLTRAARPPRDESSKSDWQSVLYEVRVKNPRYISEQQNVQTDIPEPEQQRQDSQQYAPDTTPNDPNFSSDTLGDGTIRILEAQDDLDIALGPFNGSYQNDPAKHSDVILELSLKEEFEVLSLDPNGKDPDASIALVVSNIKDRLSFERAPLIFELNIPQDPWKAILPFVFDGVHLLPIGTTREAAGKTVITISNLPENNNTDDQRIEIAFLKVNLRRQERQQLRRVVYQRATTERETEGIRDEIQNAKNILLLLPGMYGDSLQMAACMRQAYELKRFDLVLCYDYEIFDTTIDQSAEQLYKLLYELEINPYNKKQLSILAHSTGGLVARYLIEKMGGNEMVKELIMIGTPNAGIFSNSNEYYQSLIGLALNIRQDTQSLANLLSLFKHPKLTTNLLSQIESDNSRFLKQLNAGKNPRVPYSLVVGNARRYIEQNEDIQGLLNKMEQLNGTGLGIEGSSDLVVTEYSMLGMPPSWDVSVMQVACHHFNYFETAESMEAIYELIGIGRPSSATPPDEQTKDKTPATSDLAEVKKELKNLIALNRTTAALELLEKKMVSDTNIDSLILLKARFNVLQNNSDKGIMGIKESQLEMNKINHAVLNLIDSLTEDDLQK